MGILSKGRPQSFHPNLTGKVTPEAKQAIDYLFDQIDKSAIRISDVGTVARAAVTPEEVGGIASRQLTIAGKHPLNVEGLLGALAMPQKASATPVNALPGPQDPLSQNGQIVYFHHRLYWFDASTDPGVWRLLGQTIIIDTHAVRLSDYPAADNPFSLFFETDRNVLYASNEVSWLYIAGEMYGTFSPLTRPTDLGAPDAKFPFHCTDIGETYVWSGTIWNARTEIATALYDTHSYRTFDGTVDVTGGINVAFATGVAFSATWIGKKVMVGGAIRTVVTVPSGIALTLNAAVPNGAGQIFNLYEYASVNFPRGTMFFESDRAVYYSVRDIAMTVTINGAGTGVTVTSGRVLDNRWIGAIVDVNGVPSTILSVLSTTTALLAVAVTPGAGQTFTVPFGIWQYSAGQYKDVIANIPTGLLADDYGLLFQATNYFHCYMVSFVGGSFVWRFAPGDPGSKYIVATVGATTPQGGLWGICNGSAYNVAQDDGTVASVTTPNMANGDFLRGGASAHVAATAPTWDGAAKTGPKASLFDEAAPARTDFENTHVHNVDLTPFTVTVDTGDGTTGSASLVDGGHSFNSGPGSSHAHAMTNANAPQLVHDHALTDALSKMNPPSDAAGGLPANVGVNWYIRC